MIIAIDFDGTLVEHRFPEIGEPIPLAFETAVQLRKMGHKLILWTCRNNDDPTLNGRMVLHEAVIYCHSKGLHFDALNKNIDDLGINPLPKVYADMYIDDRSFPRMNMADAWAELNKSLNPRHPLFIKGLLYFFSFISRRQTKLNNNQL